MAVKSETRNPKSERRPKPEIRKRLVPMARQHVGVTVDSDFGLRISFGFRVSVFGFGLQSSARRAVVNTLDDSPFLPHAMVTETIGWSPQRGPRRTRCAPVSSAEPVSRIIDTGYGFIKETTQSED